MTYFRLTPEERAALGDRLRMARDVARPRLTVRAVAEHFDVSTNTVHHWEHGGLPSDEFRPAIAELYGVDESVLFAEYQDRVDAAREALNLA
ncbi:MAG TPA: helix-turn-helix transcriptional regulator [Acidimicrobiales bacterium]|jgi:transposase-like protein